MATLRWMHSDHVDHAALVEFLCMGLEMQMDVVTAQRDAGDLPADRIADVRYADLVADPVGCVAGLYERWGIELTGRRASARLERLRRRPATRARRAPTTTASRTPASTSPSTDRSCQPYQDRFGVGLGGRGLGRGSQRIHPTARD